MEFGRRGNNCGDISVVWMYGLSGLSRSFGLAERTGNKQGTLTMHKHGGSNFTN